MVSRRLTTKGLPTSMNSNLPTEIVTIQRLTVDVPKHIDVYLLFGFLSVVVTPMFSTPEKILSTRDDVTEAIECGTLLEERHGTAVRDFLTQVAEAAADADEVLFRRHYA